MSAPAGSEPGYAYRQAGVVRRFARRSAATRPVSWTYARIQPPIDRFVYRLTRGRTTLSASIAGLPIVMLTTTGARSGEPRTQPVLGLPDGDDVVVIASNYGRSNHPSWYHNLRADPRARVTIARRGYEAAASELAGPERDRYYDRAVEIYPGFRHYERWAAPRRIRVLRLSPTVGDNGGKSGPKPRSPSE
jgi:deazaflavin-dependent oxidoreductase (nitroreductase family)